MTSESWEQRCRVLEAELRRARAQLARHKVVAGPDVEAPDPIFVGGTGRSGTWAVGRLVGQDPDIVTIRTELRFHATHPGFRDVLTGKETPQMFADRVRDRFYDVRGADGSAKGLFLLATRYELNRATKELVRLGNDNLPHALATFMRLMVDSYALGRGATRWVETTPDNAGQTDTLHQVFPDGRIIHVVRDGRDVAASVVRKAWGPETWDEALEWWEHRIRSAHLAAQRADAKRLLNVRLEDLVHLERQSTLDSILTFVSVTAPERIRRYFEHAITAENAHVGRWREDTDRDEQVRIDDDYRERYERLSADGVTCLPVHPDNVDTLVTVP